MEDKLLTKELAKFKHNARKLLLRAVKTGRIRQEPCEYGLCTETKVEGHHYDYRKPFDVLWLCRPHHMQLHKYQ